MRGVERGGLGEDLEILAGGAQGADAADELDAHSLLDLFHLAELNVADLPGGKYMSTAAGAEVDAADFDQAQSVMRGFGNLADPDLARLLWRSLVHQNLSVFPDELVGVALGLLELRAVSEASCRDRWCSSPRPCES